MQNLFNCFLKKNLTDVFVGGYIENEKIRNFAPMFGCIYFCFDDIIFEIKSDFYFLATRVEEIRPYFDVDIDDEFCTSSIYSQCFLTENPIKISSVEYYVDMADEEKVLFFELHYFSGTIHKIINFNPKNVFGVMFSHDQAEKDMWLEEISDLDINVLKNELTVSL